MKKRIYGYIALVGLMLISLVFSLRLHYVIDLGEQLVRMESMQREIPVAIEVEDPIWGKVYFSDKQIILDLMSSFQSLPLYRDHAANSLENREIWGKIQYASGLDSSFRLDDLLWIDDLAYGEQSDGYKIRLIRQQLLAYLYDNKVLANLISEKRCIVLQTKHKRRNLGQDEKDLVRKALQNSVIVKAKRQGELSSVLGQIMIGRTSSHALSDIYIVVYKDGLLNVFDSANSIGAVLQLELTDLQMTKLLRDS